MFKKIYDKHFFIINLITSIYIFFLIISFFIPEAKFFLVGEYVFSFDYPGHIRNIIADYNNDYGELLSSTQCIGCPDFYHYSRWYSLVLFLILQSGVVIGLHPFMSYLFWAISMQMLSLYISFNLFFNKLNKFAFIISSALLILFPYKYALLGSGGFYALIYAIMIIYHSMIVYIIKDLSKYKKSYILKYSFFIGVAASFFLNIGIGYFPIVVYSTLIIFLYFWKQIFKNIRKFILLLIPIGILPILLNLPMVLSVILASKNASRVYLDFSSYDFLDAFTGGLFFYSDLKLGGALLILLLIYFVSVSYLRKKTKIALFLIYLITGLCLLGENINPSFYNFVFNNFPLIDSIRSTHRYIFFELFILTTFTYHGILTLMINKKYLYKEFGIFLGLLLLCVITFNIYLNRNYVQTGILPHEYFTLHEKLQDNNKKTIYLPHYLPDHERMQENFSWMSQEHVPNKTLYKNPYSSLLAMKKLNHVEEFTYDEEAKAFRELTSYSLDGEEFIKILKRAGIQQVIVDKNFYWQKHFPSFDLNGLDDLLVLKAKYGNLFLYEIP